MRGLLSFADSCGSAQDESVKKTQVALQMFEFSGRHAANRVRHRSCLHNGCGSIEKWEMKQPMGRPK